MLNETGVVSWWDKDVTSGCLHCSFLPADLWPFSLLGLRCSSCWARSDLQPGSPGWPSRVILGQIVQINLSEGVSQARCCWDGWTLLFWQTTFYERFCVNAASWQCLTNAEEPVWRNANSHIGISIHPNIACLLENTPRPQKRWG